MGLIQKYNPISGKFDYIHSEDSFDDITVVANYSALPAVATVTGKFYWASASQGTSWLPGSLGGTYYSTGLYYSNGTTWEFLNVPYQATQAEVNTGTNTDKFVTPATLESSTQLSGKISHSLATAVSDFLVASGAGTFVKKTLAETKTILGLAFGTTSGTYVEGNDSRLSKNITVDSTVTTAGHTGNTNETILSTLTIAAGTFIANDEMVIRPTANTLGAGGTKELKLYLNTVANLTGSPIQIGRMITTTGAVVGIKLIRHFDVETTSLIKDTIAGTNNLSTDFTTAGAYTTYAPDLTVTQYLIATGTLTNGADTINLQSLRIMRNRV